MCGRYVTPEDNDEMQSLLTALYKDSNEPPVKTGEIFPKDTAVIIVGDQKGRPDVVAAQWGIPVVGKSQLIINGRAETVRTKRTFAAMLDTGRCVVPASGFYEWSHDENKQKYLFDEGGDHLVYMAGLWRPYEDGRRFIILTTAANASMEDIHDRMPLILPRKFVRIWLGDKDAACAYLTAEMPQLRRTKA